MIFYGGHASLWFLPFAALALGPVKALSRAASRRSARTAAIGAALLGAIATCAADLAVTWEIADLPWKSWIRVAPAIFWGVALGQSLRARERERRPLLFAVAVLAFAAYAFSPFGSLPEDLPGRFSVAVSLACLGFGWKPRIPEGVREAATLTFGVYLVHPLVAKLLGTAFDVGSWTRFEHAALVWLGAASIVLALRRVRSTWHECAVPRVA